MSIVATLVIVLFLAVFAAGSFAGALENAQDAERNRRRPRLDHAVDVYSDCETLPEKHERMIGLFTADRQLVSAIERTGRAA